MSFTKGADFQLRVQMNKRFMELSELNCDPTLNSDWCDYISPALFATGIIHGSSHLPFVPNEKIPQQ